MSAIEVEHLTKRFGELAAVRDVSFDVPAGQVVAVLGPNGAGKTTLIEILEGFQAPDGDRVIVLGDGQLAADATPGQLRAHGGTPVIRLPLPPGTGPGDLPAELAAHVDAGRGELSLPSADLTADLAALVAWARSSGADLTGLEVGAPSLEDAYLNLTGSAS